MADQQPPHDAPDVFLRAFENMFGEDGKPKEDEDVNVKLAQVHGHNLLSKVICVCSDINVDKNAASNDAATLIRHISLLPVTTIHIILSGHDTAAQLDQCDTLVVFDRTGLDAIMPWLVQRRWWGSVGVIEAQERYAGDSGAGGEKGDGTVAVTTWSNLQRHFLRYIGVRYLVYTRTDDDDDDDDDNEAGDLKKDDNQNERNNTRGIPVRAIVSAIKHMSHTTQLSADTSGAPLEAGMRSAPTYLLFMPWEQLNNQLIGFRSACAVAAVSCYPACVCVFAGLRACGFCVWLDWGGGTSSLIMASPLLYNLFGLNQNIHPIYCILLIDLGSHSRPSTRWIPQSFAIR